MPGKQVKDWPLYEALVRKGKSKESAARIANAQAKKRKLRGTKQTRKKRTTKKK